MILNKETKHTLYPFPNKNSWCFRYLFRKKKENEVVSFAIQGRIFLQIQEGKKYRSLSPRVIFLMVKFVNVRVNYQMCLKKNKTKKKHYFLAVISLWRELWPSFRMGRRFTFIYFFVNTS